MTMKNGFGKCSLSVLSANEWKDQNRALKPLNGKGIVRLANRVAVWRQSEVSVDSRKFSGMKLFHSSVRLTNQKPRAFLYPFDKPIKSIYFRSFVLSVMFARLNPFKVMLHLEESREVTREPHSKYMESLLAGYPAPGWLVH